MPTGELKLNKAVYEKKSAQNKRSWRQYKIKPFNDLTNLKKGEAAKQLKHPIFLLHIVFILSATINKKRPCVFLLPAGARPVFHSVPVFSTCCVSMLFPPCPRFPWLSCVSVVTHRKFSRVQINRAKLEDSGNYTCVVENLLGRDNSTGIVNVQSSEYPTPKQRASEVAQMRRRHCCCWDCSLANWEILKRASRTGMQRR